MEDINLPSKWDYKGAADYTDRKVLMGTPYSVALILSLYLWFVLKSGPKFMKHRQPFQLKRPIALYNLLQITMAYYIFQEGFKFHYRFGLWSTECNCKQPEIENHVYDVAHLYFIAKVTELLDTVFFVLRKKDRQVTFLHVYHHTIMVICTWSITKYLRNDSSVFIGTINSFVHVVMYGYYTLSVFPSLNKYLWWKKYITIMQLVQFVLMFAHILITHTYSECKPTYYLLSCVCFNTILFLYLFGKFYINSYTKSDKVKIISKTKFSEISTISQRMAG